MKLMKTAFVSIAALSMASAPVFAQAKSAQSAERIGAPTAGAETQENDLEGENGILIALLAAAAVIAGIIIIADDDEPTSP